MYHDDTCNGWQSPGIDTGMFPIPEGLKQLLTSTNLWDEFIDLCWDAVSVLHAHLGTITTHPAIELDLRLCS